MRNTYGPQAASRTLARPHDGERHSELRGKQLRGVRGTACGAHRLRWMRLVAIILVAMLAPSAYAQESAEQLFESTMSLKGDSYSKSPLGYFGALRALKKSALAPVVLRDPRKQQLRAEDSVLLFDPSIHHYMSPPQMDALNSYRDSEATLIVTLPKRYAALQSFTGRELRKTGLLTEGASAGVLRLMRGAGDLQRDIVPTEWGPWQLHVQTQRLQTLYNIPPGWDILVGDENAAVVIRFTRESGGTTYIVSDSDFFANIGIAQADHADLLERLVRETVGDDGTLFIDEAFHGYLRNYSPIQAGLSGRERWLMLSTAFLALLLLWMTLAGPRRTWREQQVVQSTELGLAERTGDILRAHLTPVERLHKFRALLVNSVLPSQSDSSDFAFESRLRRLSELHQTTHSLASLDRALHALPENASRRKTQPLLRAYQQWFAEVTDATK